MGISLSPDECYLFVVTHSGRGVFDLSSGERISRDSTVIYPVNSLIQGIGPFQNQTCQVMELNGEDEIVFLSPSKRLRITADSSFILVERIDHP